MESAQIACAAALSGPVTWPLAAQLIARQQGDFNYSFFNILKNSGVRVAFSGCLPYASYKLFGISTQRGVQAPILNYLNGPETDDARSVSFVVRNVNCVFAGTVSGIVGGLMVTPIEQIKISLANRSFINLSEAKHFFYTHKQGFRLLMSGAKITVWRNIVFDSVNAVLYHNALMLELLNRNNALHMAVINAVAGVLTAVIDYPLDVLKTRIQTNTVQSIAKTGASPSSQSGSLLQHIVVGKPLGILSLAVTMVKMEGPLSLYYGLRQKLGLYFYVWFVYGAAYSGIGKLLRS